MLTSIGSLLQTPELVARQIHAVPSNDAPPPMYAKCAGRVI